MPPEQLTRADHMYVTTAEHMKAHAGQGQEYILKLISHIAALDRRPKALTVYLTGKPACKPYCETSLTGFSSLVGSLPEQSSARDVPKPQSSKKPKSLPRKKVRKVTGQLPYSCKVILLTVLGLAWRFVGFDG